MQGKVGTGAMGEGAGWRHSSSQPCDTSDKAEELDADPTVSSHAALITQGHPSPCVLPMPPPTLATLYPLPPSTHAPFPPTSRLPINPHSPRPTRKHL